MQAAERLADAGDLRMAADLCDVLLADDKVQGALVSLVGSLLGVIPSFEVGGSKRRGRRAVRALEADEDWWRAFPEQELTQFTNWAVLLGVSLAEIDWTEDPQSGRVPGRITFRHPRNLRRDPRTRQWMLRVGDDGREIAIQPGDGRWLLFTPKGASRPWKTGAWRAASRWYLLKDFAIRDWGTYSERHGTGTLVAEPTQSASAAAALTVEARKTLGAQLQALGRNSAIVMPAGLTLKLVEAKADTASTFEKQIDLADRGIAVTFHGTQLTSDAGGSYAKAIILNGVHVQVMASLAEALATCLHDGHIVFWAAYNFGDARLAPWPVWDTSPPEDLKANAETLGAIASACTALRALSDRIDIDSLLDTYGVPLLPEDKVAKPNVAPKPPVPSTDDEHAPEATSEEEAVRQTERAAHALTSARRSARPVIAARSRDLAPIDGPARRGQAYADALHRSALALGRAVVRTDAAAVLGALSRAESFATLRRSLREAYAQMDATELAVLVERALLLADLAGRLAVAAER